MLLVLFKSDANQLWKQLSMELIETGVILQIIFTAMVRTTLTSKKQRYNATSC